MKAREYRALVAKLEQQAAANPAGIRARVRLLVVLGYGYVLLIVGSTTLLTLLWLFGAISGAISLVTFKLAIVTGTLAVISWRALWVKIATPDGIALPRSAAPKLRARVEEVRHALRAPKVDVILLNPDYNASVSQIPRFGIFGGQRTFLTLGLPLLCALGPRQFDAVLAHEFGHLSGAHPKLGLWAARAGRTWAILFHQLQQPDEWGKGLFKGFFEWFVPRLQAHGFVMSRRDEYAADADAARITSPRAIGEALVGMELRETSYTRYYWPRLWQRAEREPEPPKAPWTQLKTAFRNDDAARERRLNLAFSFRRRSNIDDTHPALRERLHALGLIASPDAESDNDLPKEVESLIVPVEETAAEHYLGGDADEWLSAWDARWNVEQGKRWRAHHEHLKAMRARINELKIRDDAGDVLTKEELWEYVGRATEVDGVRASVALLRRVIESDEKNAHARVTLGTCLLEDGDPEGVPLLQQAMALEPDATQHCESMLRWFAAGIGDRSAVEAAEDRFERFQESRAAASEERAIVKGEDHLLSPRISFGEIQRIADAVRGVEGAREVYIARKKTEFNPQRPFYVLLVVPSFQITIGKARYAQLAQAMVNAMAFETESDALAFSMVSETKWLKKKIVDAGGLRIGPHGVID